MIVAQLKDLHSTDAELETFRPDGPFGVSMFAEVGPASEPGEELFQFTVCTPEWFAQNMNGDFVLGRHFLFVKEYDYEALRNFVSSYCSRCVGASWREIAEKISRLGYWEFEDYVPYSADR
jgi:hypothetical protein